MDLKEQLQQFTGGSSERHIDPKFSYLPGLLGLVLLVAAAWLYFSDANSQRATERAAAQGTVAAGLLMEPVQAFRAVLEDSQVQEQALEVLEGQASEEDLLALEGMTERLAFRLAEKGVRAQEDLAELSVDELQEIDEMSDEDAAALIMAARAPWFAEEAQE